MAGGDRGAPRWEVLARRGVPAFLLLEGVDGVRRFPPGPAQRDAEGEALGVLAEEIEGSMPAAGRPWPGGVALTLEKLAARRFFPSSRDPGPHPGNGELFRAFAEGRYVRAVNFHATPPRLAGRLEEQLAALAERFAPVPFEGLRRFVRGGGWPSERPGVVLSFFDGSRDNFEVAAPILERFGLVGWFFVVSGWVASPPEEQYSFARRHSIHLPPDPRDRPADGRLALSPEEVGALADRGHVVASHTHSHTTASPEFSPDLSPEALEREVAGSRRELERLAGREVRALAWREGTALGAEPRADEALKKSGYQIVFANHAVQQV